ncbi:MAG: hypothetical protein QXE31_03245 [Candidatus Woesearchaeota archaeon]
MDDISNRTLALFLVMSIVVSLGVTIYSLNKLNPFGITGQAQNVPGKVNLSVQNSISIILYNATVDFGTGFVNVSCSEILSNSKTAANLTAGAAFIDTSDCWTGNKTPTSIIVENNGNVNVSVSIRGPDPRAFFGMYNGSFTYNLTALARNYEANSCAGTLQSSYVQLNNNASFCTRLKYYPDSQDSIAIDVNVLIPVDLPAGTYENSTIEFYAVQV